MNGIYLSPEGKALIEAKVAELEKLIATHPTFHVLEALHRKEILKEILSNATVLPVEECWARPSMNEKYPNGLIIQPKQ